MEHIYFEVGTSLLAKPQALCDLVEYEGGHSVIIFCNSPSDADFADVILKKRGVASVKLIGYVPQLKLSKAVQQLQKKEITALVLTDVAARGIPLEEFDVVVNYSIPQDPEVYFTRFVAEGETKTKKVISLVSAMDITNFHFLKKLGKCEFVQAEPPSAEQLFASKFSQLRDQAIEKAAAGDTSLNELVEKVLADDKAREIVGFLLNNTLTVIPALKAAASPAREERAEFEDEEEDDVGQPDFDRQDRDGNRRDRRGGRDRDRRGNREARGNRDDRDNRGNRDDRGGRRQHRDDSFDDGDEGFQGQGNQDEGNGNGRRGRGRGQQGERGERGEGRRQRQREPRKPMMVDKEARLYVGVGSNKGISADQLKEQVVSACGVQPTDIHRVSMRGAYAFVDVPEAVADQVVEKLGDTEAKGTGEKYFVKKAVTLSIPREPTAEELAAMQSEHSDEDYNGNGHSDHESHEDVGAADEEGPTLLAVDDQA
jgi:superfamily II DNA/RNA helicase